MPADRGYDDIFGGMGGAAPMEGGDEFMNMFEGEAPMAEDDMLMRSLLDIGYDVTPEKLDRIKQILEEPDMGADAGMGGDMGMTPAPIEMSREGATGML